MNKDMSSYTTTYIYDDNYRVDIVRQSMESGDVLTEAWLFHKDYGIKTFIFGMVNEPLDQVMESLEACIKLDIESYKERFEKEGVIA